ncbi:MAG: sigma 54-interacting transcriptional regulator, partial [Firmicutes bacterium]|nr:sigma 54-interacting transcriptional regulator [Bacillota bacterium]
MVGARAKFTFDDLIGKNAAYLKTVQLAKTAANSSSNVLLLGESGTGKEVFAQAIHNAGCRANEPFIAINCAALPRDLIGSELFGYTEGAFTGAKKGGSPGKFELADGGTIFLDEIGEMPLEMQANLLRVLQEKTLVRIGGQQVIPVNVRVIAATNRNLMEEVEKKNFRSDLYYRLNVLTINMLPLRNRKDDILPLTSFFIEKINRRLGREVNVI